MIETIVMLVFLIVLSVEDIRWKEVHSICLYAFLASGILVWIIRGQVSFYEFLGGIACGVVLWGFARFRPETVGEADGIVFAATGTFIGLTHNLFLIIVSTVLAGFGSLSAVAVLGKDRDDTLPLIPFILAGYMIMLILEKR